MSSWLMAELNIVFSMPIFCLEVTGLFPEFIKCRENSAMSFLLISSMGLLLKKWAKDLMAFKYRSCVVLRAVDDSACQHSYAF
jgi:hypothetical protein